MGLPDRWLNYKDSGIINGTKFVAFKVPLQQMYFQKRACASFIPLCISLRYPAIKLVIDLTCTHKYYNGIKEFEERGIKYVKIKCRGQLIPSEEIFKKFVKVVDEFLKANPKDHLIGVHCTHGVNRTGYLIVRYMIERMGYSPQQALKEFCKGRGHGIERTPYIADLLGRQSNR